MLESNRFWYIITFHTVHVFLMFLIIIHICQNTLCITCTHVVHNVYVCVHVCVATCVHYIIYVHVCTFDMYMYAYIFTTYN